MKHVRSLRSGETCSGPSRCERFHLQIQRELLLIKCLSIGIGEIFLGFFSLCLSFAENRKNAVLKTLHLPNIPGGGLKYLHFFPVWLFE